MAEPIAQYTFLPWVRQGLAGEIPTDDDLGAQTTPLPLAHVELQVSVTLEYDPVGGAAAALAPPIERAVGLIGPGDILGLQPAALLRCHPADQSVGVDASKLAYVEFYDEDLPWRYTPARADAEGRLRPWIALWVLTEDEFTVLPEQASLPPAIHLDPARAAAALPPSRESWAWAHVQIGREIGNAEVDAAIRQSPDHCVSRLVCPRRLRVDTRYHAFIVPAFETGRLAGLGVDPAAVPAQAPSWTSDGTPATATRPFDVPYYARWTFATGQAGDFESLVRALQPGPVGDRFGKRALDVSAPGYGLAPSVVTVELEGALQPIGMGRTPFPAVPGAAVVDQLEHVLDLGPRLAAGDPPGLAHPFHQPGETGAYPAAIGDDPIVTPPIYGQHHALVGKLADVRTDAGRAWLRELNLDPRARAVAGLGTAVIRTRQEELVERAWEQVAELEHVNQRLREAELALAVTESLHAKHVAAADPERAIALTAGLQARVLGANGAITLHRELEGSQVPVVVQTAAFKRISRPQRKWVRRLAGGGSVAALHRDLVTNFNRTANPVSAAPPAAQPATALAITNVVQAVGSTVADYDADATHPGHIFLLLLWEGVQALLAANPAVDLNTFPLAQLKTSLHAGLAGRAPALAADVVAVVAQLIDDLAALVVDGPGTLGAEIPSQRFAAVFGGVPGKSYAGITVRPQGAGEVDGARTIDRSSLQAFAANVGAFVTNVLDARPEPLPRPPLASVVALAERAVLATHPRATLTRRIANTVAGVPLPDADRPRALRQVMAYPEFADPMFEDLRKQSQDFIIPNFADLPPNAITILTPNQRFIESYFAGLNHEMARELLWREYPTDQRGTYFRRFWDRADQLGAGADGDIVPMDTWQGDLGTHAAHAGGFLVLVIRGELLRRYPSTVVYAQRAMFSPAGVEAPRILSPAEDDTAHRFAVLRGWLEPDVALFGFALGVDEVRGRRQGGPDGPADPGWFFVLRERPGELELGLDELPPGAPVPALASWNDLAWQHLAFAPSSPSHISLAANASLALGTATSPPGPRAGTWGKSAADQAYILMQSPILYARHAEELLPPRTP